MCEIKSGIYVPLYTPCDEQDIFLEDVYADHIEKMLKTEIDGTYILGGTGEGTRIRPDERKTISEIAVEACKKHEKVSLVHVGCNNLRDAKELSAHCGKIGATGVSSVPPAGFSHAECKDYYSQLIEASGLPLVIYYYPTESACSTLEEMAEYMKLPGVIGLKISSWNLFFMQQLKMICPEILAFNGKDEYLATALSFGADGGIGMWYNLFPERFVAIDRLSKAGKVKEAFDVQNKLNRLIAIIYRYGVCQGFEMILRYQGVGSSAWRRPARKYTEEEYKKFIDESEPLIKELME